ncbi:hypothetical protein ATE47_04095 [Chryseobacterium sp. IHB B 17019]|uniref:hypothetical protein n=1 Tax=Chryseobacterium sp. IHB B 17019 TaxID=1721091 RepID=UPI000722AB9D|nr:hypothetical protein [Chryseobacterium sp. IHB B 17019]ALR29751.1 hypothetical protein ATE47_04095 [Chryseobacterium sp. IHB B 17019]
MKKKEFSDYFIIRNGSYVGIFKYVDGKLKLFKHVDGNCNTYGFGRLLEDIIAFNYDQLEDNVISFKSISANEQYRIPKRFDMRKKEVHNDLAYFLGRNQTFDIFYNPRSRIYGDEEFRSRVEKYKPKTFPF